MFMESPDFYFCTKFKITEMKAYGPVPGLHNKIRDARFASSKMLIVFSEIHGVTLHRKAPVCVQKLHHNNHKTSLGQYSPNHESELCILVMCMMVKSDLPV